MNNDVIATVRDRVAMLLQEGRETTGLSRRSLCANLTRRLPIRLVHTTLKNYETHGPSQEATRLLFLFRYYGIDLDSIFGNGQPIARPHEFQIDELLEDRSFVRLCKQLTQLSPRLRRGMLRAFSGFLQTFRHSTEKEKERSS